MRASEPAQPRHRFAGLKLAASPHAAEQGVEALARAVQRVARTLAELQEQDERGLSALPHQQDSLAKARDALDRLRPDASHDLISAFERDPALIGEAGRGRTARTLQALQLESEICLDPDKRADRVASDVRALMQRYRRLEGSGDERGTRSVAAGLTSMAKSLERDPQVESLWRARSRDLGLPPFEGRSLSQALPEWLGLSRSRGLER